MKKILILSCNTGQGHNSAANALKNAFVELNIECDVEDALRFISDGVSKFISDWHVKIYRNMPKAFDVGYKFTENYTEKLFDEKSLLYKLFTMGTDRLYEFFLSGNYDAVICTHAFSALVFTDVVKKYMPDIKTAFVATDYSVPPSIEQAELDYYFVPDKTLIDNFSKSTSVGGTIIASGIPVRKAFLTSIDKAAAKKAVGMDNNKNHILMMCGSMGCGPMKGIVSEFIELLPEDIELTVVCGTNEKLQSQLEETVKKDKREDSIHIKGFVDDVSLLMDSADVYITKPGGISITEAAVKGLPLVLIDAVSGCEDYNLRFFVENKMAVTDDSPRELAQKAIELLYDESRCVDMTNRQKERGYGKSVQIIVDCLIQN